MHTSVYASVCMQETDVELDRVRWRDRKGGERRKREDIVPTLGVRLFGES